MPIFNSFNSGSSRRFGFTKGIVLNPPTGMSSIVGETSVTISFTAPSGDTPSNIEYRLSNDGGSTYGSWIALSPPDITSPIVISGLTSNEAYTAQLRTTLLGQFSLASSAFSFQTLAAAPTSLSASSIATTSFVLSFTQGTGGGETISNYKFALSTNGGASYGSYTALSPADGASPITISGLTAGTAYVVKIRAVTAAGDGTESTGLSVTTPLPAPTSFQYAVIAGGGGSGHSHSNCGGRNGSGGGGGGGFRTATVACTPGAAYTVIVGAGGARAVGGNGFQGGGSSISGPGVSVSCSGGGGGGHDEGGNGQNGGSGGGGSSTGAGRGGGAAGAGTAGEGNAGGGGNNSRAGGGGGSASAGVHANSGGAGGDGTTAFNGIIYSAGGGGGSAGGAIALGGNGGNGGAGNGHNTCGHTNHGLSNRGGGGGGVYSCDCNNWEGCHGGSGAVIIRWSTSFAAASASSMTGSVTYNGGAGGFHQYTFHGTSAITVPATQNSGSITI